jgi:hypothetical protein
MKFRIAAAITGFALISAPANAVTVDIVSQSAADFTTLPLTSVSPFTPQTTGTVYFGVLGSVPNIYRSPFENVSVGVPNPDGNGGYILPGYDNLPYTSVQANSTATYTFAAAVSSLSLLWGSPDSYNYLEFFSGSNGTGSLEGTISGSALALQTYGHDQLTLALDGGLSFLSVLLYSSGSNAFEFANLQGIGQDPNGHPFDVPQVTPLPAALPLFAGGLGIMGFLARSKKRRGTAALAAS